jgi:hypothetical protein
VDPLPLAISTVGVLLALHTKISSDAREKARVDANERLLEAYKAERQREFDAFKSETKAKLNGMPVDIAEIKGEARMHHKFIGEHAARLAILESEIRKH